MIPALVAALLPTLGKLLDKVLPNTEERDKIKFELEMELRKQEGELLKALLASDAIQAEINKSDSQSSDKFKSYWRPALAWVCVTSFTWLTVLQPIVVFAFAAAQQPLSLPEFDASLLMTVLFGILGLAGYRTYEKKTGVSK